MEIAMADINTQYGYTSQTLLLHVKNTRSSPLQAALQGRDLMNTHQGSIKAILGCSNRWEEVSMLTEISSEAKIPLVSLADSAPEWAMEKWGFLIQASPTQSSQMKALAAIIQSYQWPQVTVLYEDMASASNGALTSLSDALKQANVETNSFLALPPMDSSPFLAAQLQRLKTEQRRVFVVHASMPVGSGLFRIAKKMKMMEKGYVWIVTDLIANHLDSLDTSTISSMQGVLGIKNHFPEKGHLFRNFESKFRARFINKHPEEHNYEPGYFAVQAYDATMLVASSLRKNSSLKGNSLLETISAAKFDGLSGEIRFKERKLASDHTFQIVNVIGKSYRELGLWSEKSGFNSSSKVKLGQIIWPGGTWHTPKVWPPITPANKPLRVGVPNLGTNFKEFVNVVHDQQTNQTSYTGFVIDVFKEMMGRLPSNPSYEFHLFNGTYDDLVKQVPLKNFDAVAGDVAILEKRLDDAAFTHPYSEQGVVMIVPVQAQLRNEPWLFIKPFTKTMWILILAINIYNGFAIWLFERNHCTELTGSVVNQVGVLLWLAVTNAEKLRSKLSRMVMLVWLIVALILVQIYTASLTSMLTVQRLVPTIANAEGLKKNNAVVGTCRGSFVGSYLQQHVGIPSKNIKGYGSEKEFVQAFEAAEISAAFLEAPYAKVFLAKYCNSFVKAGPTYEVGGFGFVFPKGSSILEGVNKALLNMTESGKLGELEKEMISEEECLDVEKKDETSLGPRSFSVLFGLTGGISTISLTVFVMAAGNYKATVVESFRQWSLAIRTRRIGIGNVEIPGNDRIPPLEMESQSPQV
ncbi:PREDICTED: glutamate receptor 2.5-like [Ipomoea nil]|uniref:glutamate receptor 2.5-like n=1 Tax=Ipomoea nil TaxID=35883 RepID=UPI0009010D86|nr:PREDICTED: glutamate receptor 2.5-like [Ipomoea nil]